MNKAASIVPPRRLRVAYVTIADPADPYAWSGINNAIARSLEAQGVEVIPVGPLKSRWALVGKVISYLSRRFPGHRYLWSINPGLLRRYTRQAERLLEKIDYDLVFSPGSHVVAHLRTKRPIVFWTDAPFAAMRNYYAWYTDLSRLSLRHGFWVDDQALRRTTFACYSSKWAVDHALREHGAAPSKVKLLRFGANLPAHLTPDEVPALVEERLSGPWRLLFVGVEWKRKGGDLVLATAKILCERGVPVELIIVGCQPPAEVQPLPEWVRVEGFVSQHTPEGQQKLAGLFRSALFFFMPSLAEAYGIVFCEASSFALPSLTQDTGGIGAIVENGINGFRFPLGTKPEAYADYIVRLASDRGEYEQMALRSLDLFRRRLNWQASVASLIEIFESAVRPAPAIAPSSNFPVQSPVEQRLKLGYIFHRDADDPRVQSGRPFAILRHMEAADLEVKRIFPLKPLHPTRGLLRRLYYAARRQHFRLDREPVLLQSFARQVEERTAGEKMDVFFCPGSEAVSYLPEEWPITFCADATFANMVDYYPDFTGLPPRYLDHGHALERAALSRATLAVYPSEWAANSAIQYYGADPSKVTVIPFGANRGSDNTAAEVECWIEKRSLESLDVIFLSSNWARKGGDLAVEAVRQLNRGGREVRLHVVGSNPPARYRHLPWLVRHGYLSPKDPDGRARLELLFRSMHFLLLPTRAEASARSFCEANAFGLPVITTQTGGIPSIIREGINGFTCPLTAGADCYAELIDTHTSDPHRYRELARSSFREFEERLNWRAFVRDYVALVRERISASST